MEIEKEHLDAIVQTLARQRNAALDEIVNLSAEIERLKRTIAELAKQLEADTGRAT
jgi:predicted  nucleic acid-binding Zn-ribbon protein